MRATDAAGNVDASPARTPGRSTRSRPRRSFTVVPSDPSNDSTPTFEFSATEPGSTFQCRVDGGAWAACSSPATTGPLADGSHTFEVRATDAAGNQESTPESYTWLVDAGAPSVSDHAADRLRQRRRRRSVHGHRHEPDGDVTDVEFFRCSDASANCCRRLVGLARHRRDRAVRGFLAARRRRQPRAPRASPPTPPPTRARTSSTSPSTVPSRRPRSTRPRPIRARARRASFAFSSNEGGATFECRLDGGAWGACSSPKSYSSLAEGNHTFHVRATDAAGNVDPTPATFTWTVDTIAPADDDRRRPERPERRRPPDFEFSVRPSPARPSSAARRRRLGRLHEPARLHRPRRRQPHLPGAGDRRRPATSTRRPRPTRGRSTRPRRAAALPIPAAPARHDRPLGLARATRAPASRASTSRSPPRTPAPGRRSTWTRPIPYTRQLEHDRRGRRPLRPAHRRHRQRGQHERLGRRRGSPRRQHRPRRDDERPRRLPARDRRPDLERERRRLGRRHGHLPALARGCRRLDVRRSPRGTRRASPTASTTCASSSPTTPATRPPRPRSTNRRVDNTKPTLTSSAPSDGSTVASAGSLQVVASEDLAGIVGAAIDGSRRARAERRRQHRHLHAGLRGRPAHAGRRARGPRRQPAADPRPLHGLVDGDRGDYPYIEKNSCSATTMSLALDRAIRPP